MVGDVKMAAESKGTIFAKTVQKHAGRAKEKPSILATRNLPKDPMPRVTLPNSKQFFKKVGKVDRTADEIFDDHVQNFTKQQTVATKLQKEVNNYIRCIKAMQAASKSLYECIGEVYETDWTGHDLLYLQTQTVDMLWNDIAHKITDQVLIPLNTYQAHFPEMRKKIEKRNRKLVDYDGQRHSYQSLETSTAKKRDEAKIAKAKEQVDEAKRTFGVINSELNDELPALFDSRILFYVTNLQTFFSAEQVFHSELAKVNTELETIIEKLAKESQRNTSTINRRISATNGSPVTPLTPNSISSPLASTPDAKEDEVLAGHFDFPPPFEGSPDFESTPFCEISDVVPAPPVISMRDELLAVSVEAVEEHVVAAEGRSLREEFETPKEYEPVEVGAQVANGGSSPTLPANSAKRLDEVYDIPVGATTENLPPGVLYRVRAAYKYDPEDEDELQLEVGDIVRVIEYEDPEEQEEGWLLGIKESSGQKGLFPANFTRPI